MGIDCADGWDEDNQKSLDREPSESYEEKESRALAELRMRYTGQWLFYTVSEGNQPYTLIAHGSREEVQGAQKQWSLNRNTAETEVGQRILPSIAMPIVYPIELTRDSIYG